MFPRFTIHIKLLIYPLSPQYGIRLELFQPYKILHRIGEKIYEPQKNYCKRFGTDIGVRNVPIHEQCSKRYAKYTD
jgi:hypothetical protein